MHDGMRKQTRIIHPSRAAGAKFSATFGAAQLQLRMFEAVVVLVAGRVVDRADCSVGRPRAARASELSGQPPSWPGDAL
eukprot:1015795-Alexandrium_andersonii.AAC.1